MYSLIECYNFQAQNPSGIVPRRAIIFHLERGLQQGQKKVDELFKISIENHHFAMALYLQEQGASTDVQKIFQKTKYFLHFSSLNGNAEVVKQLLQDEKFEAFVSSEQGSTALHLAALKGHLEVVKILIDKNASVEAKSADHDFTPLHLAAWHSKDIQRLSDICFKMAPTKMRATSIIRRRSTWPLRGIILRSSTL